jgi:acyl carrier protein phosphodiesterase
MNYLAHLFLSPSNEEVQVGNLMGDFIKGKQVNSLPSSVREGVKLHRAIDKFTDDHSAVRQLKTLLTPERKRFHGIISDIAFDHFLAKDWHKYAEQPLNDFAFARYQTLKIHKQVMPLKMAVMVEKMILGDWLTQYKKPESICKAIDGVSRRIRFKNKLHGAGLEVLSVYEQYQLVFEQFFPELIDFSSEQISRIER